MVDQNKYVDKIVWAIHKSQALVVDKYLKEYRREIIVECRDIFHKGSNSWWRLSDMLEGKD